MSYTLVEPCCGSAALSLFLLGATRSIMPYQGSKWRHRHALAQAADELGFAGAPSRVVLTDAGPWGDALAVILDPVRRRAAADQLEVMSRRDPQEVYESLHRADVSTDPVQYTAEFLFLQRLAFSGKAVAIHRGKWVSPGFNQTSAYGTAATDRFGAINPMVPSLVAVLRRFNLATVEVVARTDDAVGADIVDGRTLVYLDPPYFDTTAYPAGYMHREEVEGRAMQWLFAGASVIISEQHPLELKGWRRRQLSAEKSDASPFKGKQAEWITYVRGIQR